VGLYRDSFDVLGYMISESVKLSGRGRLAAGFHRFVRASFIFRSLCGHRNESEYPIITEFAFSRCPHLDDSAQIPTDVLGAAVNSQGCEKIRSDFRSVNYFPTGA
jgi:hypothetical protein